MCDITDLAGDLDQTTSVDQRDPSGVDVLLAKSSPVRYSGISACHPIPVHAFRYYICLGFLLLLRD